jgi:hypothetical protein
MTRTIYTETSELGNSGFPDDTFHAKNYNFGTLLKALEMKMLVYFMVILYLDVCYYGLFVHFVVSFFFHFLFAVGRKICKIYNTTSSQERFEIKKYFNFLLQKCFMLQSLWLLIRKSYGWILEPILQS